mgnify:CR=1 FL=1
MNIDEFIEHAKEKAEEYKYRACFFKRGNPMYAAYVKLTKDHEQLAEWLEKFKEYQQLEEQGRLVKLPCKFGTEVYNITWWDDVQEKVVVKGKTYCRTVRKHKVTKSIFSYFDILKFGKTVFLTKSEAEAKLKELRGEEDESSN